MKKLNLIVGKLKLDNNPGNYTVTITYGGSDKYNSNSSKENLTIKEEVVEAEVEFAPVESGAFYSPQYRGVIYTGDIQEGPDGQSYRHLGNNKWEPI